MAATTTFAPENDSPSEVVDRADTHEVMEQTVEELMKGDDTNQGAN